jgi:hypothetical protein
MLYKVVSLVTGLALAACGSGGSGGGSDSPAPNTPVEEPKDTTDKSPTDTQATPYSMALATAADLPACDEAHEKQLVYLLAEKQFQTCQAGAWVVIEIEAPEPELDLNRLHNAIMAIQVGDTLDDMIPEAREYLLSLGKKTDINATTFEYRLLGPVAENDCERAYHYSVKFQNNAVLDPPHDACAN